MRLRLWNIDLDVIEEPYPHIPEDEALSAMPEELHGKWDKFMRGQTVLVRDDGRTGVYPCDLLRFVRGYCRKNDGKFSG